MKKIAIVFCAAFLLSACSSTDTLNLFRDITQGKSQLDIQTGEPAQFSGSEKICIAASCSKGGIDCTPTNFYSRSPLMLNSSFVNYYNLIKDASGVTYQNDFQYEKEFINSGYSFYHSDSKYAQNLAALTDEMDHLMEKFQKKEFLNDLKQNGKTPALMFDIDNTLEFSAGPDSDPTGNGPAIKEMVDFVGRWCFKDGVDCYFVTARQCDVSSTAPTKKWLKSNLKLDEEKIRRYTFFSSNALNLTCPIFDQPTIAYKDVIREALERDRNVFWLMSVGDQLTDSLGEHSGMKIRVPNQFFHSDIVPNQFAPWGAGQCSSPVTIAPPRDCAEKLRGNALKYTNLEYCSTLNSNQ